MPNKPIQAIGAGVFASRWLLLPFNLGLIGVLIAFAIRFLIDDYHFMLGVRSMELEAFKLAGLGLIDSYMIGNLFVMIILGSYQIFIAKFRMPIEERPQWLDHIDTGLLKVKLGMSVMAISAIQLLKDYTDMQNWTVTWHRGVIHLVFVISGWVTVKIWSVSKHSKEEPNGIQGTGH